MEMRHGWQFPGARDEIEGMLWENAFKISMNSISSCLQH